MTIEGLQTGVVYPWRKTGSWKWFDGLRHWWEIDIELSGRNGVGGLWLVELWHWNGSSEILIRQPKTLPYQESREIIRHIKRRLSRKPPAARAAESQEGKDA